MSGSEEEKETDIQRNLPAREEDTTIMMRLSDLSETDKVETPSTVNIDARFLRGFKLASDTLKSNQDLDSGGVESNDTFKFEEVAPVAMSANRGLGNIQPHHSTRAMKYGDLFDRLHIEAELKESLQHLIIQNKNQKEEIQFMRSTLQKVLELQLTIVQEVQSNMVTILHNEYQKKFDNISITSESSISDHKTMVKHFKSTGTQIDANLNDASSAHLTSKDTSETNVLEDDIDHDNTETSCRHYGFRIRSSRDQSVMDSQFSRGFHMKSIQKMLPTGPLDDSAISYASAFMATPKKKNQDYTSNNFENSEIYRSSDDSQETDTSDESLIGSKDISELSSKEDSDCDFRLSRSICQKKSRTRMHNKSSESPCRYQNKKGSYIVPTESKKESDEAKARFVNALNQVACTVMHKGRCNLKAVHCDRESQRTMKTLYVGNLHYNADNKSLRKALQKYFHHRIKVEKVEVPEQNGKPRGYAFVTLSWTKDAKVNPSDICKAYSGMIDVNSRYIYLRKLRKDSRPCIDQKAPLMSDMKQQLPDWVTGPEGETVTCEDVTIKSSTSLPILEGCLTATCDQWENGKSISSIDTGQASIAHGAKTDSDLARLPGVDHPAGRTDSDLARPPGGDHPAAQHASQGVLTRSAARRGQSAAQRAHPRTSDTECSMQRLEDAASRTTRGSRRSRPAEDRTLSRLSGAGAER
jgi:RNA recognition motif-containing protein